MKLAEALLRRKEIQGKVARIGAINSKDIIQTVVARKAITENTDDIVAKVPVVALAEVTREYDFYAKRLRLIDAAIQQANWTTEVPVDACVNEDFQVPDKK